jgi:hypothetical protein
MEWPEMAKKRVSPGGQQPALNPDWEDEIPEPVAAAVDDYLKKMRAKNKLSEQERAAREKCIEQMKEHNIKRLRIDDGKQWLECEDVGRLKTRKVKVEKDDTRQSARA